MNSVRSLVTRLVFVFSLSVPMLVCSDDTISLIKPKQSGKAIIETSLDIPPVTSTSSENYGETTASKFGNGVFDIATSWLEIPKTIIKTTEEDGIVSGLTIGIIQGIANTAGQVVSGAVNVATFPVPVEMDNPMKPKDSNIEEMNMDDEFGGAFKTVPE